jgi:hypothetical protein
MSATAFRSRERERGRIGLADERRALHARHDRVRALLQHRTEKRLAEDDVLFGFGVGRLESNFDVIAVRADRESDVRRKGPRGRGPREEGTRSACPSRFTEADGHGGIFDLLVAVADFTRRQRGAAARPPPDDLVTAIEKALLPKGCHRPPHRFHVGLVACHVGVVEIEPVTDAIREAFPVLGETEDRVDALSREGFEFVGLDVRLAVDTEFFFHLHFDGKSVRVQPAFRSTRRPARSW